ASRWSNAGDRRAGGCRTGCVRRGEPRASRAPLRAGSVRDTLRGGRGSAAAARPVLGRRRVIGMDDAVIVSAVRTPVGTFGGAFAEVPATQLGSIAVKEAMRRAEIDSADEVLMGNVLQAGLGQNPARQSAMGAGLADVVPSTTINKVCGSGLKTVALAAQAIRVGDAECVVAGGMENMSRAPYLLENGRYGYRLGHGQLVDEMIRDGLWCAFDDCHMGTSAENIAREFEVSREDQDDFAAGSQQKAEAAIRAGRFKDEIVAVPVQRKKEQVLIDT